MNSPVLSCRNSSKPEVCLMAKLKYLQELFPSRLIRLIDVWEEIIIATQPDIYVGRRKSTLSVCKLDGFQSSSRMAHNYVPQLPSKSLARSWNSQSIPFLKRNPTSKHGRCVMQPISRLFFFCWWLLLIATTSLHSCRSVWWHITTTQSPTCNSIFRTNID